MNNVITTDDSENENKSSKLKTILSQIFTRQDPMREELSRFFEDQEVPIRNDQMQMILGVVRMLGFTADQVKVPLANMVSLPEDSDLKKTVETICESGHSRIPLYRVEGGKTDYTGLLYSKDLLRSFSKKTKKFKLADYMREIQTIPETQSLLSLLRDMRVKRQHLMLTANEYGDITGLITLEDILEEIVGEIKDEHDSRQVEIEEVGHRLYQVEGSMNILDLNKELAINLPHENFNTVAGFLLHELKGDVEPGKKVEYGNIVLNITESEESRISKVTVYIPPVDIG